MMMDVPLHSSHTWGEGGGGGGEGGGRLGAEALMLQGTFRAHSCGTASLGSMSVFLTFKAT